MKILSRSLLVYNIILFIIISYLYLILLNWPNFFSFDLDSIIHIIRMKSYGNQMIPFLLIAIITLFFQLKISKYFLLIFLLLVNIAVNVVLINNFDKIILLTNFFYMLLSYFVFEIWNIYISFASFNPNIKKNNIFNKNTFHIKAQIKYEKNIIECSLVNLDSESCFLLFEEKSSQLKFKSKNIRLSFIFNDKQFEAPMRIVSSNNLGVGLFPHVKENEYLWYDIYKIINKRGYIL